MGGLPTLEEETVPTLISYRVGRDHLSRERQIPDTKPKEQVEQSIERYPSEKRVELLHIWTSLN